MSRHFVHRLAVLVCGVTAAALWIGPFLGRVDLFEDDAAQHIFWLYRFADPALFSDDLTARFFSLPSTAPAGYRALYALLAPRFDVLQAGEVLAAGLFLASLGLARGNGRGGGPPGRRGVGGGLSVLSDAISTLALQRSFALPITLLMLWAMLGRRPAWVCAAWILAALMYPVIIVVLGLAAGGALLFVMLRDRRWSPALNWYLPGGAVAIGIVLAGLGMPDDIGPALDGTQAMAMPEFGPKGRLQLVFGGLISDTFHNHLLGLGWSPRVFLVVAAATLLVVAVGRTRGVRVPAPAWFLLASGLLVWWLARQVLFDLYLPNRHSRWSFAAYAVAVIPLAGVVGWRVIEPYLGSQDAVRHRAARWAVAAVGLLFVVARYLPAAEREWSKPVDTDMERAYAFISTLPADTLVAAQPDVANFIPLRSHRAVLASTETSLSFMRGYYEALVPRLRASLRATYAVRWESVEESLAPYGVDVYVSAPAAWSGADYYAPFDELTSGLRRTAGTRPFILQVPPEERVMFRSGDVFVVRIGDERGAVAAGAQSP